MIIYNKNNIFLTIIYLSRCNRYIYATYIELVARWIFRGLFPQCSFRRSEGIDRWPSWYSSVPRPPVRRTGYMAIRAGWHRLSNKLTSSHDIRL